MTKNELEIGSASLPNILTIIKRERGRERVYFSVQN